MKIGQALFRDNSNRNLAIKKSSFCDNKIYVNDSLYFENVSDEVWEYQIGGYQVLDKYLKSHKNEEIDYRHFEKMIQTLHKSLEIEAQIAGIDIFDL